MIEIKQLSTGRTLLSVEGDSLRDADLRDADLRDADLRDADLSDANLPDADLSRADLSRANLSRANLSRANLRSANLSRANLSRANLSRANLSRANLRDANLRDANLYETIGDGHRILSLALSPWAVVFCDSIISIGCETHTVEQWRDFPDRRLKLMDDEALTFWEKWKDTILGIADLTRANTDV